MPDPARLTDQFEEARAVFRKRYLRGEKIRKGESGLIDNALSAGLELEARLAAAENVVEAARAVSETSGSPHDALDAMYEALNVYDAQKEPTGNHAESSTTRGDTHE